MTQIVARAVQRFTRRGEEYLDDRVVTEAPLTIRVQHRSSGGWQEDTLAVTLRTPGADAELAMGLLLGEGLIAKASQVRQIVQRTEDRIIVQLTPEIYVDTHRLARQQMATASCGMCGKASAAGLTATTCYYPRPDLPGVPVSALWEISTALRQKQSVFQMTGGIHAAGLFSATGAFVDLREDIGRHNALDKLLGSALQRSRVPLRDSIILLSGRVGYELVQKVGMAGVPVLAAVGAPSSMAIEQAEVNGITLIGFLREDRFNVYTGVNRLIRV